MNTARNERRRAARRKVRPGYPKETVFATPEQLAEYFGGELITCLRCGKELRGLGTHLRRVHGMEPDAYRNMYGIPWTYGLEGAATRGLKREQGLERWESGKFKYDPEKTARAQEAAREQRSRQPVRDVLTQRALEKMNDGKSGEETARRKLRTKRGTPEHRAAMLARPQTVKPSTNFVYYWLGRSQTGDHVLKRTGYPKKK